MKKHLKRLASPKSWPIKRKISKWITRPNPGYKLERCMALNTILKEILSYVNTTRECKKILNEGKVVVNKKIRKDHKFSVGFMDVLEFPLIDEYYRVLLSNKGKIVLKKINKKESNFKLSKVIGKKILKKGKIQINLEDGRNFIIEKNGYKVNDSVLINLSDGKIKEHLKFEKGNLVLIIGGKHIGDICILEKIEKDKVIVKKNDKKFETLKDYAFVVGKGKAVIAL